MGELIISIALCTHTIALTLKYTRVHTKICSFDSIHFVQLISQLIVCLFICFQMSIGIPLGSSQHQVRDTYSHTRAYVVACARVPWKGGIWEKKIKSK